MNSSSFILNAEPRNNFGKVAAANLRSSGCVPAVIYAKKAGGGSATIMLDIKQCKQLLNDYQVMSRIVKVNLDGKVKTVLLRDLACDIVTDEPIHMDFMEVKEGDEVSVMLPVEIINKDKSIGVKRGGEIVTLRYNVPLLAKLSEKPLKVLVDVEGSIIGQKFKLSDAILPEGTKMKTDMLIVKVTGRKASHTKTNSKEEEATNTETEEKTKSK